jgi:hypothetical protein
MLERHSRLPRGSARCGELRRVNVVEKEDPPTRRVVLLVCNKDQNGVRKLIAGLTVFICNECVEVCSEIFAGDDRSSGAGEVSGVKKSEERLSWPKCHPMCSVSWRNSNRRRHHHLRKPGHALHRVRQGCCDDTSDRGIRLMLSQQASRCGTIVDRDIRPGWRNWQTHRT